VVKKLKQVCRSVWPNQDNVFDVFKPFNEIAGCCTQCNFLEIFLIDVPSFWKYVVVKQIYSNSITSSNCKSERSGKEDSDRVYFL
jgi:hypothetical protein